MRPQAGPKRPCSGWCIPALGGVIERSVDVSVGKPAGHARRAVLNYRAAAAENCLVVGDRLNTDIALGADAGMTTVLTMTGITDEETLADASVTPDYVIDSLADLDGVIDGTAERYAE